MEENQERKFYPTYFFLVTGFSFLLFALMLSVVDGRSIKLFWWIGGCTFFAGLLTGLFTVANRSGKGRILH